MCDNPDESKEGDTTYWRATSNTCPICLDPVVEPCVTPCGHCFCKRCIVHVVFQDNLSAQHCPVCRGSISPDVVRVVSTGEFLMPQKRIVGSIYNQHGMGHLPTLTKSQSVVNPSSICNKSLQYLILILTATCDLVRAPKPVIGTEIVSPLTFRGSCFV